MTFLRKLINLSGCAKIKTKTENEIIDNNDDTFNISETSLENDSLIRPHGPPSNHNYVPWQSPRKGIQIQEKGKL